MRNGKHPVLTEVRFWFQFGSALAIRETPHPVSPQGQNQGAEKLLHNPERVVVVKKPVCVLSLLWLDMCAGQEKKREEKADEVPGPWSFLRARDRPSTGHRSPGKNRPRLQAERRLARLVARGPAYSLLEPRPLIARPRSADPAPSAAAAARASDARARGAPSCQSHAG